MVSPSSSLRKQRRNSGSECWTHGYAQHSFQDSIQNLRPRALQVLSWEMMGPYSPWKSQPRLGCLSISITSWFLHLHKAQVWVSKDALTSTTSEDSFYKYRPTSRQRTLNRSVRPLGSVSPGDPELGRRARLPGPLQKTAAFHAIKEAAFKSLTFKYNQDLPLLEAKSGFGQ